MIKPISNSSIENSLPLEGVYLALTTLIENNISNFPNFLEEATVEYKKEPLLIAKEKIAQEDDITISFGRFFRNLNSDFDFEPQSKTPESNATTDIGIISKKYSKHRVICFVEAKRLPTPLTTGRQETEYVYYTNSTKQGGIERFKTGKHAGKEKLNFSIMLGYIQEENAAYWHKKINGWIDTKIKTTETTEKLIWTKKDKLRRDETFANKKVSKYKSSHLKLSNDKIDLIHYWFNV